MNIKQARESLGLTQYQLAARMGWKFYRVERAENEDSADAPALIEYLKKELASTTERWFKIGKSRFNRADVARILSRVSHEQPIIVSVSGNIVDYRPADEVMKENDIGVFSKCSAEEIEQEL